MTMALPMPTEILNTRGIYLIGAVAILLSLLRIYRVLTSPTSLVPGPWYTKWTGFPILRYQMKGIGPSKIQEWHQKYGPVVRIGPNEIDFADVTAKKTIYTTRETFRKAPIYQRIVNSEGRESVFSTSNVDEHRRARRLLGGSMTDASVHQFEPTVREKADMLIRRLGEEMEIKGFVDVHKWLMYFATDVIGELSFGESFRMLDVGKPNQYMRDLTSLASSTGIRVAFGILMPLTSHIWVPVLSRLKATMRRMNSYARESIERHKQVVQADSNHRPTLMSRLLENGNEKGLTDEDIVMNARAYIIAGTDTTANSLTYLVWRVLKRQDVREKLLKELRTLSGDFDSEVLAGLPYLNQVIQETLRLHPAVPGGLPRSVPTEGATISGYWLPGGTVVRSQSHSLHRDPETFPNPDEFEPARWEKPTKAMEDAFFAFGGGARVCLGVHLAKMEMLLATALFFLTYPESRASTMEGMSDKDMKEGQYFLLEPMGKRCLIELF